MGCEIDSINDIDYKYLYLKKRLISNTPRRVLYSKEFTCSKKLKKVVEEIKNKIENGIDINPYLSKKKNNIDFNDGLLNDWNIHHLHLGKDSGEEFVERTKELLFVKFDKNNAYFINVYKHGAWAKQEMVRIIHNNWPESIKAFKLEGVKSTVSKFSDKDYSELRNAGISTIIQLDENISYLSLGMGYMSSGHNAEIVMLCNKYRNTLVMYEEYIQKNINYIAKQIEFYSGYNKNIFKFHLCLDGNRALAYELYSDSNIELGNFYIDIQ